MQSNHMTMSETKAFASRAFIRTFDLIDGKISREDFIEQVKVSQSREDVLVMALYMFGPGDTKIWLKSFHDGHVFCADRPFQSAFPDDGNCETCGVFCAAGVDLRYDFGMALNEDTNND